MIRIVSNTYPKHEDVPHAEQGDICMWEINKGQFNLVRSKDSTVLFSTAPVDKEGKLRSNGNTPVLVGIVGQVKSKGWELKVEEVSMEEVLRERM